jgi:hypothetical protein
MRTNLKNITLVLAQFAIASTSCINTKAPMPITTFKLTKDSTMLGIWGHLERDPSEGPSDLFRGFSFVILPIYSKNDRIIMTQQKHGKKMEKMNYCIIQNITRRWPNLWMAILRRLAVFGWRNIGQLDLG